MKQRSCLFFLGILFSLPAVSQKDTEVYLATLTKDNDSLKIGEFINISNNEGYDNQPSFYNDKNLLFSSTRNGQTDIALYNIEDQTTSCISDTPTGSEYSPLKIPGKEAVSAIRLDDDGLQRLYEYDVETGKSKALLKDLKVGYHVWYNENIIVSSVLAEDRMDLVVSNLKDHTNKTVQKNVGRSLHKIPNTDLISYISKENKTLEIKSLNPVSGATQNLNSIWNGSEDIAWLTQNTIIAGTAKAIVQVPADTTGTWRLIHQIDPLKIYNISRIAISSDQKLLALVSDPPPYKMVQKQVESYNAGNLEAFVNCYDENVVVRNFPSDTLYIGHDKMRENYSGLSPENKTYDVEVVNRIVIGNQVIDHEKVIGNGKTTMQVAIYEVKDRISSMTFIFDKEGSPNPEPIVQKQLEAYNARDIDAFMATYSQDVKLYNFPNNLTTDGPEAMRKGYSEFFKSASDLRCEIKNRIVIGNKVIDHEEVTANGNTFNAVAIYEVKNGRINLVTFLR